MVIMKKFLFSPSTKGLYLKGFHANIPEDAKECTQEQYESAQRGTPIEMTQSQALGQAKSEIRELRAPMLDALSGIAGRAVRSGNDSLAAEADALAVLLLDITDDQALNVATTYEEMQAAGVAAYKRIAATASPSLSIVFKEITGA